MPSNQVGSVPKLTFVSMNGPTLDVASAKAMRAHTTKTNFARRRRRLVQEFADRKENDSDTGVERSRTEQDGQAKDCGRGSNSRLPIFSHRGLSVNRKLDGKDSFFIDHRA